MAKRENFLATPERMPWDTVEARVTKVFDGDGFLVEIENALSGRSIETPVRCGFIDAPEMEQAGGPEAQAFLETLILGNALELAILLKTDTQKIFDRHGRIVAIPYLPCTSRRGTRHWPFTERLFQSPSRSKLVINLELEMILNGWAWVLDRYGPDEVYLDALSDAKANKRGIWANDANQHPWEFKKSRYRRRAKVRKAGGPSIGGPCRAANCNGSVVLRTGRHGQFLGCSNFPTCKRWERLS